MYCHVYLLIVFLTVFSNGESFDEFYKYVDSQILATANWTRPMNNKKLYATNDGSIKFHGSYDFIIIGGGSAGAVLAGRLSEILQWKVLLLEAGTNQTKFSDIPGMSPYLYMSDFNWGYLTTPQSTVCQGMKGKRCVQPRGKALGGCAVINGMVNARGIPEDFEEWVKLGNPGWSYHEVLPYFQKTETVNFPNADPFYYGKNGPLHVNFTTPPSLVADAFLNANIQNGFPEIDYNGKGIQGVSRIQFHINGNRRDNSAHGYLDPLYNKKNLEILLQAFVTQIIVKDKVAQGVEFIKNGQRYYANATKEVILSAGTINSPQILLLSGIGPARELQSLGIRVQNDLPAVGKHLQDHATFFNLYFRTNLTAPNRSLKEQLQRYEAGLTPLTNGHGLEQLVFLNTKKDSLVHRNVEIITIPPPFSVPESPQDTYNLDDEFAEPFKTYNTFTDLAVFIVLLKPKSRGSVTLKSSSPLDYPNINVNYYSDPYDEDIETVYRGIKTALNLLKTEAFRMVNATYIGTQPRCEHLRKYERSYWHCAIRKMSSTIFHPVGTTRMGCSTTDSVVNTDLKVHNMRKLRVVDAGVMPTIVSGHTNAPTYMIAEKISHKIKQEYGFY